MRIPKTLAKACQVLRHRVRLTDFVYVPSLDSPQGDITAIRRAIGVYTETWIIPLLDAIERGDLKRLDEHTLLERGTKMDEPAEGGAA